MKNSGKGWQNLTEKVRSFMHWCLEHLSKLAHTLKTLELRTSRQLPNSLKSYVRDATAFCSLKNLEKMGLILMLMNGSQPAQTVWIKLWCRGLRSPQIVIQALKLCGIQTTEPQTSSGRGIYYHRSTSNETVWRTLTQGNALIKFNSIFGQGRGQELFSNKA